MSKNVNLLDKDGNVLNPSSIAKQIILTGGGSGDNVEDVLTELKEAINELLTDVEVIKSRYLQIPRYNELEYGNFPNNYPFDNGDVICTRFVFNTTYGYIATFEKPDFYFGTYLQSYKTYTLSFWSKGGIAGSSAYDTDSKIDLWKFDNDIEEDFETMKFYSITFTVPNSLGSGNIYIHWNNFNSDTIELALLKIEEGDYPTVWMPCLTEIGSGLLAKLSSYDGLNLLNKNNTAGEDSTASTEEPVKE